MSHGNAGAWPHLPNALFLNNAHAITWSAKRRRRNAHSLEDFNAVQILDQVERLIPAIRADWIGPRILHTLVESVIYGQLGLDVMTINAIDIFRIESLPRDELH